MPNGPADGPPDSWRDSFIVRVLPRGYWFAVSPSRARHLVGLYDAVGDALGLTSRARVCLELRPCVAAGERWPSEEDVLIAAGRGGRLPLWDSALPSKDLPIGSFVVGRLNLERKTFWDSKDLFCPAGWRLHMSGEDTEPPPGLDVRFPVVQRERRDRENTDEGEHAALLAGGGARKGGSRTSSAVTIRGSVENFVGFSPVPLATAKNKAD